MTVKSRAVGGIYSMRKIDLKLEVKNKKIDPHKFKMKLLIVENQ